MPISSTAAPPAEDILGVDGAFSFFVLSGLCCFSFFGLRAFFEAAFISTFFPFLTTRFRVTFFFFFISYHLHFSIVPESRLPIIQTPHSPATAAYIRILRTSCCVLSSWNMGHY